jgi:4-amino-4-deoxy-L-arabinose transferase and related glycosyltransferases of PMT family
MPRSGEQKVNTKPLKQLIKAHYPLVGVLIGSFLIATSMGTYTNWDAQLEYEAATAIAHQGFPYLSTGLMINQPPFGFYTAAGAFQLFGSSYLTGVSLTTLFGVGAVALVYALGALLYGRKTGLVASALFGLIPWHVYMSRTFLIDNQYLFWSLLFLVVGVQAVRRNSDKLVAFAGVVFALALLSKLFAVFALIPLALIVYFAERDGTFPRSKRKLLLFALPILVSQAIWYGGFAHQNFLAVYFSTDFSHPVYVSDPSPLFVADIWVKGAGVFLFASAAFAVVFAYAFRAKLKALLRGDLICILTVAVVAAANLLLVLGFHLTVPYVSVLKYTYLALPFLCLLAASVADKGAVLLADSGWKKIKAQWVMSVLVAAGLLLVFASMLESVRFLDAWYDYASFGVDTVTYYPFNLYAQTAYGPVLHTLQYGALVLILVSLFLPAIINGLKRVFFKLN